MAAKHPAERSVRGSRHGTCPPLAARVGHNATVPTRSRQQWTCPPLTGASAGHTMPAERFRDGLEPRFLG
jgi:hypothetical protein